MSSYPRIVLLSVFALAACRGDEKATGDTGDQGYGVPLDPESPWPKFRRNAQQDGRSPVVPSYDGSTPWSYSTAKGIFSSPVVDGDGNVYIGSADRTFYALDPAGDPIWTLETGEIIDSSALLDDGGQLYFGSGDGLLRAVDRASGAPIWTFAADDPAVNGAYINWFEGNVAIGPAGDLYAPNDNFFVYALDRSDGSQRWTHTMADQTWSLPAVDPKTGNLWIGNNNLLSALGDNTFSLNAEGEVRWSSAITGTIAASACLTPDGLMLLGGFDGYLRAYDAEEGDERWSFATRDHLYASASLLSDGTIIQPGADGTVYALDPADGGQIWAFDTREPIRSSAAVDGSDNIYLGSGEGRLYVINPDGSLRWGMQLITDGRNDLNASPALGNDGIFIAGESGEIFRIPYDYCLEVEDERCIQGPAEGLPGEGVFLLYTTPLGNPQDEAPSSVDANATLAFSLFVREAGDTSLAFLDAASLQLSVEPEVALNVLVSGDRRFVTVEPVDAFKAGPDGTFQLHFTGPYLVNAAREGLAFSGGEVGGQLDQSFAFALSEPGSGVFPFVIPEAPGDDAGVFEIYRISAPLPTILPSYNQIGFDSLHYLVGLVEPSDTGAVGWFVGALPVEGEDRVAVDPQTTVFFPVILDWDDGLFTLQTAGGLSLNVMNLDLSFSSFRIAASLDSAGGMLTDPQVHVSSVCGDISFYGIFLRTLGFCNPDTDVLDVFGTALIRPHESGVAAMPGGLGSVQMSFSPDAVSAELVGATALAAEHAWGIMLLDSDGAPVNLDYPDETSIQVGDAGVIQSVALSLEHVTTTTGLTAWLMVDTSPVAATMGGTTP